MRYYILVFLIFSFIFKNKAQTFITDNYGDTVYNVSIIKILSNPEEYHNKKVVVIGYLHCSFENSAIYLSEEFSQIGSKENAIWVSYDNNVEINPLLNSNISLTDLDRKYVLLAGFYDMNNNGHFGRYAGSIINVSTISLLKKNKNSRQSSRWLTE